MFNLSFFACIFGYSVYKDTATLILKNCYPLEQVSCMTVMVILCTLMVVKKTFTRKNVTYDDLPQVLVDAIVAAEDSRFFEHNGFDLPRIVKAALSNLKAGDITGGRFYHYSTKLTQKEKTYFPDAQRDFTHVNLVRIYSLLIQADKALSKKKS